MKVAASNAQAGFLYHIGDGGGYRFQGTRAQLRNFHLCVTISRASAVTAADARGPGARERPRIERVDPKRLQSVQDPRFFRRSEGSRTEGTASRRAAFRR